MNAKVKVKKESGRRRGAKRRALGWALVALGVAVMGLSAWSRGRDWTIGAEGHSCEWSLSVTSGVVQAQFIDGWWDDIPAYPDKWPPSKGSWVWRSSLNRVQAEHRWWGWKWFRSVQPAGSNTFAAVPLWVFAVCAAGVGGLFVRAGRRARGVAGRCRGCGYDLSGLEAGVVCPECGVEWRPRRRAEVGRE